MRLERPHRWWLACLMGTASCAAGAQEPAVTASPAPAQARTASPTITETAPVRVLGQRPPRDPFAFHNPVDYQDTVFERRWDEPPSLEEIGLRGGIVQIAINHGLEQTARAIRQLPGWKDGIRHAVARPPPLDDAHQSRAAALTTPEAAR